MIATFGYKQKFLKIHWAVGKGQWGGGGGGTIGDKKLKCLGFCQSTRKVRARENTKLQCQVRAQRSKRAVLVRKCVRRTEKERKKRGGVSTD